MEKLMQNYKFIKYASIYDNDLVVYGLEFDGVERVIGDAKFIEVTPDFKRVTMVRADSVKPVGTVIHQF